MERVSRWLFGPNPNPHRAIASWIYVALVLVVTAAYETGPLHGIAQECCAYRGQQGGPLAVVRLFGGAFLAPPLDTVLWGCLGLAIAATALERRIGTKRWIIVSLVGHASATLIADLGAVALGHADTLHDLDVGSSVVMVTNVAALAVITRSWKVWTFLIGGLFIDTINKHDLSTFEHYVAAAIGIKLALVFLRSPSGSHEGV